MKPFEEFKLNDLLDYISLHNITKMDGRAYRNDYEEKSTIVDYLHLSSLLACTERNARAIVSGAVNIRKHHYDLLAFHTKSKQPELV
jgi:hypothetical protein